MLRGEKYVAFDLGAESGRVMLGALDEGHFALQEVSRFANRPVQVLDGLHWDVLRLWQEMLDGLARTVAGHGSDLSGIGLDTWGVDYALLDHQGALLGLPYHYRDKRTEGIEEELYRHYSEWDLYSRTGMAFAPHNTLCQLLAMRRQGSPALDVAHSLLMMPALFNYWLCGRQANETTIAGTTQFHDLWAHGWSREILEKVQLPSSIPAEIVPAGTVLGPLLPAVAQEVGLGGVRGGVSIIAPACHDTPAAAAVVPSQEAHATFISSGTWSVVGTELEEPLVTPEGLARQFVVETAACGRLILVHNSMGLWPVQECRREWLQEGHDWSYADLAEMAAVARPFAAIVDPDNMAFFQPGAMTAQVRDYCRQTGQDPPSDPASMTRTLLEGLALRYRRAIEDLEHLTSWPARTIHIVGGGSRNALLCQLTADATQRPVLAGPAEATSTATVLLQALARGRLSSLGEVREIVAGSCSIAPYEPQPSPAWDEAYGEFMQVTQQR